ncbi:MAG: AAA family ATPase, partial [Actinomycetota bacterium]|nr:AAA family ATPase [Actinomycetota bacterium]
MSAKQVVNVLAREGEYWTVVFDGRVSRVRHAKGLQYLDHLLRHPEEEFHALSLVAAVEPPAAPATPSSPSSEGLTAARLGDAGPVLDAKAVGAYRQRFRDLQEELADAEQSSDPVRMQRAQDELDALTEQLASGLGLGGRHRRAGSAAERARLAVTKAIRSAIRRLEQADPALGRHLEHSVRTGTFCTYAPDPALSIVWREEVGEGEEDVPGPSFPPPTPHARVQPARRRSAATPFVGRPLERGLMTELVAAAAAGRGGLVLISGEAGIGKTRLAEEALSEAERRGIGGFVGRCVEGETSLPWLPLVEVLEQVANELGDAELLNLLGGGGPDVARILPALRRRFPNLAAPAALPAEQARQFLFATIRDVVLRLGSLRPAVLVVEDIHWADPATLHMLQHLVDGLEDARVLVIATYRGDEAPLGSPLARTLERLARHPAGTTLTLGPLGVSEVSDLIRSITGHVPPDAFSSHLQEEADGNPFFVQELVKHLDAEEHLYAEDGRFRADLGGRPLPVPASLRLILGHRLHQLSSPCRDVVKLAAVAGRDVDVELLAAAGGSAEDSLMEAVEEAMASGVLAARAAGDEEAVGFSHALLRQAALAELSAMRRRRLHLQVAEALRRRYGEDPQHAAEVADHLEQAGSAADRSVLLGFLDLAARRSLDSAAYEDAADRFRRALALVPPDDRRTRAALLAGLGYA